jgi:hypothetical protein
VLEGSPPGPEKSSRTPALTNETLQRRIVLNPTSRNRVTAEVAVNDIIYLVGLVVVVGFIASFVL